MTILEMKHISKAFGANKVLDDIHFTVEEGEIHALLGENGAGKSTLMNILTGVIPADAGMITFLGKKYPTPTIAQMEAAGIAFVHQELNVINDLTVSDNIFLCRELRNKLGILKNKEQIARTKQLFESLGVDIDPTAMVSSLKTSEKQLLEICRALYVDAKLLILDEPANHLDLVYQKQIFSLIGQWLAQPGRAVLSVVHDLSLARRYGTHALLMDHGTCVACGETGQALTDGNLRRVYGMDVAQWMRGLLAQWQ